MSERDSWAKEDDSDGLSASGKSRPRTIRSCTHCRQQKVKCDAGDRHPLPCTQCAKSERKCIVDPQFKPERGGQVQLLKYDLTRLKNEVEFLKRRESFMASVVAKNSPEMAGLLLAEGPQGGPPPPVNEVLVHMPPSSDEPILKRGYEDVVLPSLTADANDEPPNYAPTANQNTKRVKMETLTIQIPDSGPDVSGSTVQASEFVIGEVVITAERALELHTRFVEHFLPFVPIMHTRSPDELYRQSKLLFWTVILTASLGEPEPTLYYSLCDKIKLLAIEECWIKTPRSVHVVQALLILGHWPLPNSKVLDDLSFRFITVAKTVGEQLGLHRGKFLYEFSRSQVSLPNAEKWRTRAWLAIFISEHMMSAILGLPSGFTADYLVETGRFDESLPPRFLSMLRMSFFYSKLVAFVGSSLNSPDGLTEARSRCSTLWILNQEFDSLTPLLDLSDPPTEMYYLYVKLMMCCFAFLPGTSKESQAQYIDVAFHSATKIVTLFTKLADKRQIIEYPIYVRQPVSYAAFVLFRLHLSPLLMPQYVESARQSVVTVHRLYRNMLTAWKDLENDISRTAKVLEKLNFVIITHPYLLTHAPQIVSRMRSHLAASIFYELVWAIHEARRRSALNLGKPSLMKENSESDGKDGNSPPFIGKYSEAFAHLESVPPLPFYNQITKDDFTVNTITTPNGTSVTKLVPNHPNAAANAFVSAVNSPAAELYPKESTSSSFLTLAMPKGKSGSTDDRSKVPPSNSATNFSSSAADLGGLASSNTTSNPGTGSITPLVNTNFLDSTGAMKDPLHLDALMQGIDWMNGSSDDFLGWLDTGISPANI